MPWRARPRGRSRATSASSPRSGCPTAAATRSRTCGPSGRCRCSPRRFRIAVRDGSDEGARGEMALAATFAGLGFGNAGVHVPHANAYPIAGRVRDFHPEGYPIDEPMVPHGMAVSLTAPEAFRFTFESGPGAAPARPPGCSTRRTAPAATGPAGRAARDPRSTSCTTSACRTASLAVGYDEHDVDDLVDGRSSSSGCSPRARARWGPEDLHGILTRSLQLWD